MIWREVGIATAVALFAGLPLVLALGYRLGARARGPGADGGHIGALQGAALGLLGLLLSLSFSGASTRFLDRQDLITFEANTIGTAALRSELLGEPARSELRDTLRRYTALRVEQLEAVGEEHEGQLAEEALGLHVALWKAASSGVAERPALAVAVLGPVNELIDLYKTREMAAERHLPDPVVALLIACSVIGVASIGYGAGLAGGRAEVLTTALAVLVAAALWVTLDLDHPRAGLIRMNDAPLRALTLD